MQVLFDPSDIQYKTMKSMDKAARLAMTSPLGVMYMHKTTSPQNTSFPGLNLKVGKVTYRLGKMDPN